MHYVRYFSNVICSRHDCCSYSMFNINVKTLMSINLLLISFHFTDNNPVITVVRVFLTITPLVLMWVVYKIKVQNLKQSLTNRNHEGRRRPDGAAPQSWSWSKCSITFLLWHIKLCGIYFWCCCSLLFLHVMLAWEYLTVLETVHISFKWPNKS